MNKKNKFIILSLTVIFPVLIILLINLISSLWIITSNSSIKTDFIEKPDFNPACELDLESILTDVKNDYSAVKHAPEVDSSLTDEQIVFINEHYTITYYKNGIQVTNPVDAGTYTAIYFNKTTHRVTEIEFEIEKIDASFNVNQEFDVVYYSPTIFETINTSTFTATGINNSTIIGTFTALSQGGEDENGNETDGVINEGTSSTQISLKINVEFDTDNPNYNDATFTIEVPIHAVCHIGAYSSPKYYGRIENALKAASNNDTSDYIYVLLKGNDLNTINKPIIYENCAISAKDTLVAPYSLGGITVTYSKNRKDFGTKTLNGTNGYLYNWSTSTDDLESKNTNIESGTTIENRLFADMDTTTEAKYLKTIITLNNDVIFTVNGKLILGGVLGNAMFSDVQGHTSGNYTQINMRPGSKIICNGNMENRGYIKEVDSNDNYTNTYNCEVVVNNNGTLAMPYVIYDYNGGANMIGCFKGSGELSLTGGIKDNPANISPYNQFDMPNIQTSLKIEYGGSLKGYADVYTGSISVSFIKLDEQHNSTSVDIVGKSNSLFNLKQNSSIRFETILNIPGYTSEMVKSKVTKVFINGNVELGGVSMTVTVAVVTETVSSAEVSLPISYLFNINVESGTFTVNNSVKVLPGAEVNINNGSTVNIGNGNDKNSELIIYSAYSNGNNNRPASLNYPTNLSGGLVNIYDGNLNIKSNSSLGGTVIAKSRASKLVIDTGAKVNAVETEGWANSNSTIITYFQTYMATESANGYFYNSSSNEISMDTKNFKVGTYGGYEVNEKVGWTKLQGTITFNPNGGTIENNSITIALPNKIENESIDINGTITSLPKLNKDYFEFTGWYTSVNCLQSEKVENLDIYDDLILYAGWVPIDYDIEVIYIYMGFDEGFSDDKVSEITNVPQHYNYNFNSTLSIPVHPDNHSFVDWYTDENCTNSVGIINGQTKVPSSITVYGLWVPQGYDNIYHVSFSFNDTNSNFDSNENNLLPSNRVVIPERMDSFISGLDTFISYNNDITYSKYFVGWYTSSEFTEGKELTVNSKLEDNMVIYGKWEDKATLTVKYYHENSNTIFTNDSLFIIPGTYTIDSLKSSSNTTIQRLFNPNSRYTYNDVDYGFKKITNNISYNSETINSISLTSGSEQVVYMHYLKYVNVTFTFDMDLGVSYNAYITQYKYSLVNKYTFTFDGITYDIFSSGTESGEKTITVETFENSTFTCNNASKKGKTGIFSSSTTDVKVSPSSGTITSNLNQFITINLS